jgi:hypothetical protein
MFSMITKLLSDFVGAISSDQSDVTLDPAIAELRERISAPDLLAGLSIYSRAQLREMDQALAHISTAHLKSDPLLVAVAVGSVLDLFDRLATSVRQASESKKRIDAGRSVQLSRSA